jgi:mono/diheme cytochrome c family protein
MTPAGVVAAVAAVLCVAGSWVAWEREAEVTDASAPAGAALFRAKGCASCHTGPDSSPHMVDAFPDLSDAPEWAADRRPGLSAADYLTESIRQPGVFISPAFVGDFGPTDRMPDLNIDDREVDALVAYLLDRTAETTASR